LDSAGFLFYKKCERNARLLRITLTALHGSFRLFHGSNAAVKNRITKPRIVLAARHKRCAGMKIKAAYVRA